MCIGHVCRDVLKLVARCVILSMPTSLEIETIKGENELFVNTNEKSVGKM